MPTDHWFYSLFQSTPDLIALLLQVAGAAGAAPPSLGPESPGNQLYRFEAVELKAVNHRLDGVLWPQRGLAGTARRPVVKLELHMQRDTRFKHRLGAQTLRFLQLHPKVRHLRVVVVVPHRRLNLGPARLPRLLQLVIDEVLWISLEELGQKVELDPLLNLLTLPVLHEPQLQRSSQLILESRPDLTETVFPIPAATASALHPGADDGVREDSHPGAAPLASGPGVDRGRPTRRPPGRPAGRGSPGPPS